ncbi:hypothetical protein A2U01_0089922, partial [Trifolium medium]|nr:hypothetical protein [Trifolium medium]
MVIAMVDHVYRVRNGGYNGYNGQENCGFLDS